MKNLISLAIKNRLPIIGVFVSLLSFFFFGPQNLAFFSSDQAIQVLMTADFQWPVDAYYWGQNRLGSFLPLVALPFVKLQVLHPIWILGILNYGFLLGGFFLSQKWIPSFWGKLIFLIALFFPHPTYIYLFMIGHPYAPQFFCLVVSLHYFLKLNLKSDAQLKYDYWRFFWILSVSLLFAFASIWISEVSVIIFPVFAFIWFQEIWLKGGMNRLILIKQLLMATMLIAMGVGVLLDLKHAAFPDPNYHKWFISSLDEILIQLQNLWIQVKHILLLQSHHSISQCLYYYFLFFVISYLIFYKKRFDFLFLIIVFSSIMLFFSNWNFRSNFDAKYYIPVYVALVFWISRNMFELKLKMIQPLLILTCFLQLFAISDFILITRNPLNIFETYASINSYPKGVYYGEYWDVYRMSAASNGHVYGVSNTEWDFRNIHKMPTIESYDNWYLNKVYLHEDTKIDSAVLVFGHIFLVQTETRLLIDNDSLIMYTRDRSKNPLH